MTWISLQKHLVGQSSSVKESLLMDGRLVEVFADKEILRTLPALNNHILHKLQRKWATTV